MSNWCARVFARGRVPRCNRRRPNCEIDHELVCARCSGRPICRRGLTKLQGWEPAAPQACRDAHLSDRDAHAPYRCVSRREFTGGNSDVCYVSFSLRAATGDAGATIKAMDLTFANGVTATFGADHATSARVGPGKAVSLSDLSATGSANVRATSVQIRVLLTDDRGRDSVALAAAGITSTYVLSGRITNKATGRPIEGARVAVTFAGDRAEHHLRRDWRLRTSRAGMCWWTSAPRSRTRVFMNPDLTRRCPKCDSPSAGRTAIVRRGRTAAPCPSSLSLARRCPDANDVRRRVPTAYVPGFARRARTSLWSPAIRNGAPAGFRRQAPRTRTALS